jgi:transposase-like protein
MIYTTNAVEALDRSLRKIIKTRGSFPNDEAAEAALPRHQNAGVTQGMLPFPHLWKKPDALMQIEPDGALWISPAC